jgi:hypothetical protein
MRKSILFLLASICLLGCLSEDNRFDDIDFMAYAYRKFPKESSVYAEEWRLLCKYYALIDNHGNCELVVSHVLPKPETNFYSFKIEKKLFTQIIKEIIDSSQNVKTEIDLRPKHLYLYDGSDLSIKINKGSLSKTIYFREYENRSQVYEKLYLLIDSIYDTMSLEKAKDTINTSLRKIEFMNHTQKSDSLLSPLPPLGPRDSVINYVPPIVIDTLK